MVGFALVRIVCNKPGARFVNVPVGEHGIDMAGDAVVTDFMGDGKTLESFVVDMGRVADRKVVAEAHQHAGHAARSGFGLDQDAERFRDGRRIDRQAVDAKLLDEQLGFVRGKLIAAASYHYSLSRLSRSFARFASAAIISSANRRSESLSWSRLR